MKRPMSASLALVAALSSLSSRSLAQSRSAARPAPLPPPAEQCITAESARDALACPRSTMALTAQPAAQPAAQRAHTTAPTPPQPTMLAPDPHSSLRGRSLALLRDELRLLAQLWRSTPRSNPQHVPATLRLAETLLELASTHNAEARAMDEPIFRLRQRGDEAGAARLARQQHTRIQEAQAQRAQLVAVLEQFVEQHGDHARLDYALFTLGFTLDQQRQGDRARQAYQLLLQRCPQSGYVPNAFLAFAEHYFDSGAMDAAAPSYERVIAASQPDSPLRGYALYKLAWTEFNRRNYDGSLRRFFETIDHARAQQATQRASATLLRTARAELVTVYGALYGASRTLSTSHALATFRRYADGDESAVDMLEKLGDLYADNGQWPNAVAVFHELIAQRPGSDRVCVWQARVARAFVAQNRREDIQRELTRLVDVYDQLRAPAARRSTEAQHACRDHAARVLYDTASHWHLEALGHSADNSSQTRGTRDPRTLSRVADLYDTLLARFADLDQVTFPDYDRRDWPTRYRVAYFRAEILRAQSDFAACGPAFDRVVELDPAGSLTEDAAYKSVLCYNDLFARTQPRPSRDARADTPAQPLAAREFSSVERAMFAAFTRYTCVATSALRASNANASSDPNDDPRATLLTIQYRRAYLAYSARHFEQAATLFRVVATPDSDDPARAAPDPENLREIAADLLLDSLAALGRDADHGRPACFDDMERALPALRARFCAASQRAQHESFCQRVDLLGCQLGRQRAEALGRAGRFHESAVATIRLLRERAECRDRADLRADEMLFNAALMYDAAHELSAAMRVRERLVELYLPSSSPWAQRALYRLGGNYHAIQVFGRAADSYERYADYVFNNRVASQNADDHAIDQAASALRQATLFRVALGEDDKALADASAFARNLGREARFRRQAASVLFSIGQLYQDRARRVSDDRSIAVDERRARSRAAWSEVVRHYTAWVDRYAREGTLDQQLQGHVALGRAFTALGDEANAQRYLRAATLAWGESASGPAPGEARVREQLSGEGQAAIVEALEKSQDAVAEARFGLAELVYQRFMRTRVPALRNVHTRDGFDAWTSRTLRPYVQAQLTRLRAEAEPMFETVMRSGIPHWQIAAAARLADMYIRFATIVRESPFPPDWNRPGPHYELLRDQWRLQLDEQTQPLVERAKSGYQACLTRATRARWFNEWSQLCERNLNEIDRAGFPLAEELRVSASLIYSRPSNARVAWVVEADSEP
jgi:TolA-binding protein